VHNGSGGQPQIITLANLQNLLPMQQVQQLTQNQQNQGIKTISSNGTTIQPIFSVQGLPGQFIQVDSWFTRLNTVLTLLINISVVVFTNSSKIIKP